MPAVNAKDPLKYKFLHLCNVILSEAKNLHRVGGDSSLAALIHAERDMREVILF